MTNRHIECGKSNGSKGSRKNTTRSSLTAKAVQYDVLLQARVMDISIGFFFYNSFTLHSISFFTFTELVGMCRHLTELW